MFLKELDKKESKLFINLVKLLAKVDEIFVQKEEDLIKEYILELGLENEHIEEIGFEACIEALSTTSKRNKNIIYFELVGLALVDGNYDEKELEFLNKTALSFNINKDKQEAYVNYFKNVKDAYECTVVEYESKLKRLEEEALKLLD